MGAIFAVAVSVGAKGLEAIETGESVDGFAVEPLGGGGVPPAQAAVSAAEFLTCYRGARSSAVDANAVLAFSFWRGGFDLEAATQRFCGVA